MRYLVTGTAGFIGFHLARRLLADGHSVTGFDGFTPYYDVSLKEARHALLERSEAFTPVRGMLEDADALKRAADRAQPDVIIHLAAQAGVRHSIDHPDSYIDANIRGTFNVLELARRVSPAHLLIASTSSVYGANHNPPFTETDESAQPLSLYAATKKAGEVMAHSYAHLFRVPTTCFRFFTVYGPWGRPDMALFKFVRAILAGEPIEIYGHGQMRRDFTYVDDLVEAILRLADTVPAIGQPVLSPGITDTLSPEAAFRVVNIGGEQPVDLLDFIDVIERAVGRQAQKIMRPMQAGDVPLTVASPRLLEALTGYKPATTVETGVAAFVAWYRDYFRV